MMRRLALVMAIGLSPLACLAQDGGPKVANSGAPAFTDAELVAVIGLFQASGCALNFENAPTFIQTAGLDAARFGVVVAYLLENGMAKTEEDGKVLRLGPGMCKT